MRLQVGEAGEQVPVQLQILLEFLHMGQGLGDTAMATHTSGSHASVRRVGSPQAGEKMEFKHGTGGLE